MPLWSDGQITLRADAGPLLTVPRPFALIGRTDGADLRLADRAISARHVYLHLDRRGLFAVDLATRTGSRFDGVAAPAAWLCAGGHIQVASHRIEVFTRHTDGRPWPHAPHDPAYHLTDATDTPLIRLSLHPLPGPHTPPWTLNSELVFLGRSLACGVPIVGGSAARVHAVIVRTRNAAYVVNLAGWGVWLDGQLIRTAALLDDGALLVAGSSRFEVRVESANKPPSLRVALTPDTLNDPPFDPNLDLADPVAPPDYSDSSVDVRFSAGIDLTSLGGAAVAPDGPPEEAPAPPAEGPEQDAAEPAEPPSLDLEFEPEQEQKSEPEPRSTPPTVPAAATDSVPTIAELPMFPAGLTPPPGLVATESQAALMGWLLGAVQTIQSEMLRRQDEFQHELVRALHALHRDNQDALELHQERVDAIHRELTELREDIRQRFSSEIPAPRLPSLPKPPPRINPADVPPNDPAAATAWLLNRVTRLDDANRSSWRDLLGRISPK